MLAPMKRNFALWGAIIIAAAGLSACGSSDKSSSSKTTTAAAKRKPVYGKVLTTYQTPGKGEGLAATILKSGGTDTIGAALGSQFKLPHDIQIIVHTGSDGPFYDPRTRTINLSYGFADFTGELIKRNDPSISDHDLGESWAAVNAFLLIHEFGHALIDQFKIPVTGKEEDAVDALAAVFLTKFVKGGDRYSFDAADFFSNLSARQSDPTEADYFDEHSLDKQRAYEIVCWIAGSSQNDFDVIQKTGLLSSERLDRCPSEYEQKVTSWLELLKPHFRVPSAKS